MVGWQSLFAAQKAVVSSRVSFGDDDDNEHYIVTLFNNPASTENLEKEAQVRKLAFCLASSVAKIVSSAATDESMTLHRTVRPVFSEPAGSAARRQPAEAAPGTGGDD